MCHEHSPTNRHQKGLEGINIGRSNTSIRANCIRSSKEIGERKEMSDVVRHKMPREMADVLDKIVEKYGKKQGIKSRDELISWILSTFTGGAKGGSEDDDSAATYNH
jgi:hypothetical protein